MEEEISIELREPEKVEKKIEKPKPKKPSKEEELYIDLERLWKSILEAASTGNTTGTRKLYTDILNRYKKLYL